MPIHSDGNEHIVRNVLLYVASCCSFTTDSGLSVNQRVAS